MIMKILYKFYILIEVLKVTQLAFVARGTLVAQNTQDEENMIARARIKNENIREMMRLPNASKLRPSEIKENKKSHSTVLKTSDVPLSPSIPTLQATVVSSMYQPVIHLENASRNDFLVYLAAFKENAWRNITEKFKMTKEKLKTTISEKKEKILSQKQVRTIFRLASYGKLPLLRCRKPEATISIKCFSNIAKISITSDSEFRFDAKLSIYRSEDEIVLDGYKMNSFVVWWRENETESHELTHKLSMSKVTRNCESCENLETVLLFKGENHACLIPVKCGSPKSHKLLNMKKNNVQNGPLILSSLALHYLDNKDGSLTAEKVRSGGIVDVIVSATSDVIPVGIFVKECEVSFKNGRPVILLSNGCSISNLLDNFKSQSAQYNSKWNLSVKSAQLSSFTVDESPQNLTLGCTVWVCEGICDVHSSCQNDISDHGKELQSKLLEKVYLETFYTVLPENNSDEGRKSSNTEPNEVKTEIPNSRSIKSTTGTPRTEYANGTYRCPLSSTNDNLVSRKLCYIYLVILSCLYLLLLGTSIVCMRYKGFERKASTSKYEDEIESPPRIYYGQTVGSARKRSPNNSNVLECSR